MKLIKIKILVCFFMVCNVCMLTACEQPIDNSQNWLIGKDQPMKKTLLELDAPKNIRFCSDKYKHISFPLVVHVVYDDNIYYGLLEGVCITVRAKTLKVKFANPSSGKVAYGTYEILSD